LPPDPARRTEYRPGELAQRDLWFPAVDIPLGQAQKARLPVITGVCGYSRVGVARGTLDPDFANPRAEGEGIVAAMPDELGTVATVEGAGHYPPRPVPG
jgi:hypothetical protein